MRNNYTCLCVGLYRCFRRSVVFLVCLCSVACSFGDHWSQSVRSCTLTFLTFCTLHQPHFLSELCFPQVPWSLELQPRGTTHCELCCLHARTTDCITLCSCALFSNTVLMCRIWCCRTATAHSPPTVRHLQVYVRRCLFPFFLRNVGVSFNKLGADGTVSHSFLTSKLIRQPLVSSKFNIQFYGSVINLRERHLTGGQLKRRGWVHCTCLLHIAPP